MRVDVVLRYIGVVMLFIAMFMLLSAGISYLSGMDSAFYPLLLSSLLTALLGAFPLIFVGKREQITNKEGFCIVVGAWLVACVVSMFPYLIWGGEFSLVNAWFESVSGLTTTGSTILNDVEALPRGLQFWRMSSTWIGGMGVVMFALVVLPSMGRSKMMLSNVELSTMAKDNYRYRSQIIVQILLVVYGWAIVLSPTVLPGDGGHELVRRPVPRHVGLRHERILDQERQHRLFQQPGDRHDPDLRDGHGGRPFH